MSLDVRGERVVVVGLGRSGAAAARLLVRSGARVVIEETKPEAELGDAAHALRQLGAELRAGRPLEAAALAGADRIVVSPGVPLALPALARAREDGKAVWGEIELAARALPASTRLFGITGTNGKSTTTALAGALFEAAGEKPFVGGNLGTPLSEAALQEAPPPVCVVELSSYQL